MSPVDLVTLAEVQIAYPDLDSSELIDMPSIITGTSVEIGDRYPYAAPSQWRDESRDPGYDREIMLRWPRVTKIGRIRADNAPVLTLTYTGAARTATAEVLATGEASAMTATGIEIVETTAGVAVTVEFPFAGFPTIAGLATAISARAGWTATPSPTQLDMPSVDIEPAQGPSDAKARPAQVRAYTRDLNDWSLDRATGTILIMEWRQESYEYPGREWACDPRSTTLRVSYLAGWIAVPADVKRAAILTIGHHLESTATAGPINEVKNSEGGFTVGSPTYRLPGPAERILSRYKRRRFS